MVFLLFVMKNLLLYYEIKSRVEELILVKNTSPEQVPIIIAKIVENFKFWINLTNILINRLCDFQKIINQSLPKSAVI